MLLPVVKKLIKNWSKKKQDINDSEIRYLGR